MDKTYFIRFSDDLAVYSTNRFDGYLSFLPPTEPAANTTELNQSETLHPSYRYYGGKDFYWFEFKDISLSTNLSMQISAPENCLWLLINMRTGISLTLDSIRLVPRDVVFCYQTLVHEHQISLGNKSSWFLLLGIDGHLLQELTMEYEQLKSLSTATDKENIQHRFIGMMTLHAKLKRILDGLAQMEFRPFSTYYQLAHWNIRFFRHVFQEMGSQATDRTDHEIELYYKAISYIRENFYDYQINISTIASALHVSESTLKRAFRGKPFTVGEQITEFRLQEARKLITESDRPIAVIAASLNFACPKNFKRLFTKRFMISPLEYKDSMCLKRIF